MFRFSKVVFFGLALTLTGGVAGRALAHGGQVHANDQDEAALQKKLKALLPQAASFKLEHVGLPNVGAVEAAVKKAGGRLKDHDYHPPFYIAVAKQGHSLGLVFFTTTTDDSDVGVSMDAKAGVLKALAFSGPAAKLPAAFVGQFRGKGVAAPFVMGKGLALKGADAKAAAAFAGGVKKAQLIAHEWIKSKTSAPAHGGGHGGH